MFSLLNVQNFFFVLLLTPLIIRHTFVIITINKNFSSSLPFLFRFRVLRMKLHVEMLLTPLQVSVKKQMICQFLKQCLHVAASEAYPNNTFSLSAPITSGIWMHYSRHGSLDDTT